MTAPIYEINCDTLEGNNILLDDFKDKVMLIVNTASKCGFTPQYKGLQELYDEYQPQGFTVLGFPCNQFAKQEPGDDGEIASFCETRFGVTFPLFKKVEVNGDGTHDLFKLLKSEAKGLLGSENIKWNFTKFLVNQQGEILARYAPKTEPKAISKDIEKLLAKS